MNTFPIMTDPHRGLGLSRHEEVPPCPKSIPWDMIGPHNEQALRNHSQTLTRLKERGGLAPCEAVAVLEDRKWKKMPAVTSCARLIELLELFKAAVLAAKDDKICPWCEGTNKNDDGFCDEDCKEKYDMKAEIIRLRAGVVDRDEQLSDYNKSWNELRGILRVPMPDHDGTKTAEFGHYLPPIEAARAAMLSEARARDDARRAIEAWRALKKRGTSEPPVPENARYFHGRRIRDEDEPIEAADFPYPREWELIDEILKERAEKAEARVAELEEKLAAATDPTLEGFVHVPTRRKKS